MSNRWSEIAKAPNSGEFAALLWPATEKLLELGKLWEGARVLDLATGQGTVAIGAALKVGAANVTAIDSSPEMIDRAKARAATAGQGAIDFRVMDAAALSFPDKSFDVVYCQFALHLLPDARRVLEEVKRILKPDGRVAALLFGDAAKSRLITLGADALAAAGKPAPSSVFSLGAEGRIEALLKAAGFLEPAAKRVEALVLTRTAESYWNLVEAATGWPVERDAALMNATAKLLEKEVPSAFEDFDPYDRPAASGTQLVAKGSARLSFEFVLSFGRNEPEAAEQLAPSLVSFDRVVARARAQIRELMPHEVRKNIKAKDTVFLDVRQLNEVVANGKLPGAIHLPLGELEFKAPSVIADKQRTIVTYCNAGKLSALAAARLQELGYENVWNILGGFTAWTKAKFPIEKK